MNKEMDGYGEWMYNEINIWMDKEDLVTQRNTRIQYKQEVLKHAMNSS